MGDIAPGASSAPVSKPKNTTPKLAKKVEMGGDHKNSINTEEKVLFIRGLTAMCALQLLQCTMKTLSTFGGIFVSGKELTKPSKKLYLF